MASDYFDMAIDHFWRAQSAQSDTESAMQTASGLQQFAAAVQESSGSSDSYFPMCLDHFWRAQNAASLSESLLQIASGLQQFCAATKGQY